jgi:pimeloyl-ACP methyl ester carboxylesterase
LLCGTLAVPIDRAEPDSEQITLAFRLLPRTDTSQPAISTVVVLPGGPGHGAGSGAIAEGLLARHDHLFMDPRGAGASGAIDCPDLQDGFSSIPELRTAVAACGAQLGDHADRYSSADIALDLEDLRAHLRLEELDMYGVSFGTIHVQAYAARFPDRVHAVVLDSGFTIDDDAWQWELGYPDAWFEIIARYCKQTPACAEAHPDVPAELSAFIGEVTAEPVRGAVSGEAVVLDGASFVGILDSVGPFPDNLAAWRLLDAIAAHAEGDVGPILALRDFVPEWPTHMGDVVDYSEGMRTATACNDDPLAWDPADPIAERERKLGAAIAAFPDDAFAPFTKEDWIPSVWPESCLDWPAPDRWERVLEPGATIDVPALILAGEQDNITPTHVNGKLLDVFPNATYALIPRAVHGVYGWSTCPRDLIATFLETLEADGEACGSNP